MMKQIDQSRLLLRLLEQFSNVLAKKRGLPIVIGIGFVAISFVFQTAGIYSDNTLIDLVGVITHNLGVLIALVGILLATPLGK